MSQAEQTPKDITGANDRSSQVADGRLSQVVVRYPMHVRDGDRILPYGRDTILWGPQDPLDWVGRKCTYPYIPIPPLTL